MNYSKNNDSLTEQAKKPGIIKGAETDKSEKDIDTALKNVKLIKIMYKSIFLAMGAAFIILMILMCSSTNSFGLGEVFGSIFFAMVIGGLWIEVVCWILRKKTGFHKWII